MVPIPPTEMMLWIELLIPYIFTLFMVIVGMYVADRDADRKKAKETGVKDDFVLSWTDLGLYSILASVFVLASMGVLLQDFMINFWFTMTVAGGMGLVFRPLLPKLQEIITVKIEAVIQAMFK